MRSGRVRVLTEDKSRTQKLQRRAQRKGKCSTPGVQNSRLKQLALSLTLLQGYFKKPGSINKFAFLKDPTAAIYSNPDNIESLPPTQVPQILGSVQTRQDASGTKNSPRTFTFPTASVQHLEPESPLQETSEDQTAVGHNVYLVREQPNDPQDMSNATVHKNSQVCSTLITAQVHATAQINPQGVWQRDMTVNLCITQFPITLRNLMEAFNDPVLAGTCQQSTLMFQSSSAKQGAKERLDICIDATTGKMTDTWLQSLSITNGKTLVEALDLKKFDLSNTEEQYLNPLQLSEKATRSPAVLQQERVSN
ncbi:hypothetical protein NDU88_006290 [Pleurodeles waltl]|uniref:Uncharacterized protein n=1 Tax=Pleurodeles waltl TaxID=8319 RepID=A0AAV7TD31_PLEWA|nr:hypothetical protein NDU88_006290 [Pleurodeles waltl]